MTRTENELKKQRKNTGSNSHSRGCGYPSEPCSCEVYNVSERRTSHENWCNYPSGPCDCGVIGGMGGA